MEDLTVRPAGPGDLDSASVLFDAYRQFYGAASDGAALRLYQSLGFVPDTEFIHLSLPLPSPETPQE